MTPECGRYVKASTPAIGTCVSSDDFPTLTPMPPANEPVHEDLHRIKDSVSAERGDEGDQPQPACVSRSLALFLNITR